MNLYKIIYDIDFRYEGYRGKMTGPIRKKATFKVDATSEATAIKKFKTWLTKNRMVPYTWHSMDVTING